MVMVHAPPPKVMDTDRLSPDFRFRWTVWTVYSTQASGLHNIDVDKVWSRQDLIQSLKDTVASAENSDSLHCSRSTEVWRADSATAVSAGPIMEFSNIHVVSKLGLALEPCFIIKNNQLTTGITVENFFCGFHVTFRTGIDISTDNQSFYRYQVKLMSFHNFFPDEDWFLELETDLGRLLAPEIVANEHYLITQARVEHGDNTIRIRAQKVDSQPVQVFRFIVKNGCPTSSESDSDESVASFKTAMRSPDWVYSDDPMVQFNRQPNEDDSTISTPPTTPSGAVSRSPSSTNSENSSLVEIHSDLDPGERMRNVGESDQEN